MDYGMIMAIVPDGALLGTAAFALLSAVSALRRKHRRGVLFGMASMASYMLFVWQWHTPFAQEKSFFAPYEITWFELAFRTGSYAFRQNTAVLGIGLVLALVNVLGILWQRRQRRAHPFAHTAAD